MENFDPMTPGEILALTGQVHPPNFEYDKIIVMYYYISKTLSGRDTSLLRHYVTAAVLGLNLKEKRVVDVAVHPYFRRLGFGNAIVKLAVKEYGVDVAYTVNDEAAQFWKAIGWKYAGRTTDKGTPVDRWMTPEKATDVHMR